MNMNTIKLFHELMKKGFVDRSEGVLLWNAVEDAQIREELDQMGEEIGFELIQAQNRLYLVPTQENDIFLKNNLDYRADIKASNDVRNRELYLMNYLTVYLFYLFFKGEGQDMCVRDFISKEELIKEFTKHCKVVEQKNIDGDEAADYGDNFRILANDWLGKKEGDSSSKRVDERYGIINKMLLKLKAEELFTDVNDQLKPTKKTKDLMPYVLRKERLQVINQWMEEMQDAADK